MCNVPSLGNFNSNFYPVFLSWLVPLKWNCYNLNFTSASWSDVFKFKLSLYSPYGIEQTNTITDKKIWISAKLLSILQKHGYWWPNMEKKRVTVLHRWQAIENSYYINDNVLKFQIDVIFKGDQFFLNMMATILVSRHRLFSKIWKTD